MSKRPTVPVDLPELNDWYGSLGYKVPKYFTDEQVEILERNPEYQVRKNDPCLVCADTGSFVYNGDTFECWDDAYGHVVTRLIRLYWLHNIKLQYQQLDWNEWPTDTDFRKEAKETVDTYVKNFSRFSTTGVGLTFFSKGLGTGKTWAATATLKRLIKEQGVDGWFAPFYEVKSYYEIPDPKYRAFLISRVQTAPLLVLDEVKKPDTSAQRKFYADKLEELIRPRSDANFATIITTNMEPEEMEEIYPRVFSLVSAKNIVVELNGQDARVGEWVWRRNTEAGLNGESLPIT